MKLDTAQTDELILRAARIEDGAIEDCEENGNVVCYFFESSTIGTVNLNTGEVVITTLES